MFPNGRSQSGGNRIDVTTLEPFNRDVGSVTGTGTYQTILNISGKGFLESFYSWQNGPAAFNLRITVDGVVKALLGNTVASKAIGVATKADILDAVTQGQSGIRTPNTVTIPTLATPVTAFKSYPTIDGSDGLILLGSTPIYFYQSLLLEINNAGGVYHYHYAGAYQ